MKTPTPLLKLLAGAAIVLTLGACTTTTPAVATASLKPPTLDELMGKAAQASASGNNEAALGLWKDAAKAYPADKTPWVRMAQTRYDAGQYGEAIINAQEALVRDPADKVANSVIAVGGLRLSTRALADLSRQNNLSTQLRIESQDLAKLLRESLGEPTLLKNDREKTIVRQPPAGGARRNANTSVKPAEDSSANPFDGLK